MGNSEKFFETVFQNSLDILIVAKVEDGRIIGANPALCRILGYEEEDLLGKPFSVLFPPEHATSSEDLEREIPFYDGVFGKQKFLCADGSIRFMDMTMVEIPWGEDRAFLITLRDATERKEFEERIKHIALHDTITDLPNRRLFMDRLKQSLAHANRYQKKVVVMYVDLDRSEPIADNPDHKADEVVLKEVAQRLRKSTRDSDTVARIGGDEFAIILQELKNLDDAGVVAQRIIEMLSIPLQVYGQECTFDTSIGISVYPLDGKDVDTLIEKADAAMYDVKRTGRNSFSFYRRSAGVKE